MKKKIISLLLCMTMAATMLAGCGKKEEVAATETPVETEEEAVPEEEIAVPASGTYAFVPKSADNAFNEKEAEGFKAAVEGAGATAVVSYPADASVDAQLLAIESLIFQGIDGICVAANDETALSTVLQEAMDAGIKVCSVDSAVEPSSRTVHCNQAGVNEIGLALLDAVLDITGGEGKFAVLSTTSQATNQNAWIDYMKGLMESDSKYSGIELVEVAYGYDELEKSTEQAKALLANYSDLKVICAPTTVGMMAAAQVIQEQESSVKLTGLGLPSEMEAYIGEGEEAICPYMFLCNPIDLGALGGHTIMAICNGTVTGAEGESFSCDLGDFCLVPSADGGTEIILGAPYKFDASNIAEWAKVY